MLSTVSGLLAHGATLPLASVQIRRASKRALAQNLTKLLRNAERWVEIAEIGIYVRTHTDFE